MVFMQTTAQEIMYGGAAGGGKSYGLRMFLVNYCMEHPGAKVVLFRRTYRELEDTHILALQQELPSYIARYKVGTHDFIFENGSILMCRFCEKEEDVYSYDTFECDVMAFDELTAFTEFQYSYLLTRCRSTKPWWTGRKIISATNPGNVGHVWVKRRFIDVPPQGNGGKAFEIVQAPELEGGMIRQFIPAKVTDNPILMKYDPDYIKVLRGLPDELYRAKALGDWNVFTGQFFSRWRPGVHVVERFTPPAEWQRYICVDWGIAAPHAVYWAARPPSTSTLYLYREQYGAGIATREQAQMARDKTVASGEKVQFIVCDPAMWAKERDADGEYMESNADVWKAAFRGIAECVKGNNERLQGASLFREMLDWQGIEGPDGIKILVQPRLFVMDSCPNFIRTVPGLVHSKTNVEDVDTDGEDHAYDSVRYLLRSLFNAPEKPKAKRYILDANGAIRALAA